VDVLGRILGEKREGAAHSKQQKNSTGDANRELFAVQHTPH